MQVFTNQLTGTLPLSFASLKLLTHLAFHQNQISGPIPPEWNMTSLMYLRGFSNKLEGNVPSVLCAIPSLLSVNLTLNPMLTCYDECLPNAGLSELDTGDAVQCAPYAEIEASALCGFVAATNISSISVTTTWQCNSSGYPVTNPCGLDGAPTWQGINCEAGKVVYLNLLNTGVNGKELNGVSVAS